MTVFRDRNAATRERVRIRAERIADDLAGIDPFVCRRLEGKPGGTIARARVLLGRARKALEGDALEGDALAELEQRLDDIAEAVATLRAESPTMRRELLSPDHPFHPPAPRAFTSGIEDLAWTFGRRSGAEGLEETLQKHLSWATDLELSWQVDPRKVERSYLDLFVAAPLWGALSAHFVFEGVPLHLLCETQVNGGNVSHHLTMSGAVAASLGTAELRFMHGLESQLPRVLGEPLAGLAHFDVPHVRVSDGTAHVYVSFDIEPRVLTAMRDVLLGLRELSPLVPLREVMRGAVLAALDE